MNTRIRRRALAIALLVGATTLAGCAHTPTSTVAASTPVATNPPGDIPDTQQFVVYNSATGRFRALYPEGWARSIAGNDANFTWSYDGERLGWTGAHAPPAASLRDPAIVALATRFEGIDSLRVTSVALPGGRAILATFASESKADPVTTKRIRLENQTFVFYRAGRVATLDLWAPAGADNVDQWRRVSRSFAWR